MNKFVWDPLRIPAIKPLDFIATQSQHSHSAARLELEKKKSVSSSMLRADQVLLEMKENTRNFLG